MVALNVALQKNQSKIGTDFIFTSDLLLLSSPSAAAAFMGGAGLSGNEKWKIKEGVSLKKMDCVE